MTRLFLSIYILGSCFVSSFALAESLKLQFPHPVQVGIPGRTGMTKVENVKPGADVNIATETVYWINARGKIPVLVVPVHFKDGQDSIKLKMPDVATWPPAAVDRELEVKLTNALDELIKFQIAIGEKNVKEAERALAELEKIKSLEYYSFLRASLFFVQGNVEAAKESVKKGLKKYPDKEHWQQLFKSLEDSR